MTALVSLADVKAKLNMRSVSQYDAELIRLMDAATPIIEARTGPMVAGSRTFTTSGGGDLIILPYAFNTVTTLTENGVATTDFTPNPTSGIIYAGLSTAPRTFNPGVMNIVATVTVGNATIPKNVYEATLELIRVWWQQSQQANRPGTADADGSSVPMGFAVPRRVEEMLRPTMNAGGFA